MKKSLALWTVTLVVLLFSLNACCGGGSTKEKVVVVPAEGGAVAPVSGATTGQELQDLKAAHDQGALTDEEYEKAKQKILTRE